MLEILLVVFSVGLLAGISSSAPFGVINLWVTDRVLEHAEHRIFWFLVGVILADVGHAVAASLGYHLILQESGYEFIVEIIGGVFVLVMGVFGLLRTGPQKVSQPAPDLTQRESAKNPDQPSPTSLLTPSTSSPSVTPKSKGGNFWLGLMMCGLNPGFLVFWMFIIDQVERRIKVLLEGTYLGVFALGILVGDLFWFQFVIGLARKGRDHVNPKTIKAIRLIIAWIFIGLGVTAVYKGLQKQTFFPMIS